MCLGFDHLFQHEGQIEEVVNRHTENEYAQVGAQKSYQEVYETMQNKVLQNQGGYP